VTGRRTWGYHAEPGSRNPCLTAADLPGLRRPGVRRSVPEWDPVTWGGDVDEGLDVEVERVCPTCGAPLPDDDRRRYCDRDCQPSGYRQQHRREHEQTS
jgi:hypothetical protein